MYVTHQSKMSLVYFSCYAVSDLYKCYDDCVNTRKVCVGMQRQSYHVAVTTLLNCITVNCCLFALVFCYMKQLESVCASVVRFGP